MSSVSEGNSIKSADIVDVESEVKENAVNSENTCDSGLETSESSSVTLATFPTTDISSREPTGNQVFVKLTDVETSLDIDTFRTLSSSTSITPDNNDTTHDLLNLDNDTEQSESTTINFKTEDVLSFDVRIDDLHDAYVAGNTQTSSLESNKELRDENSEQNTITDEISVTHPNIDHKSLEENKFTEKANLVNIDRDLAKSTISLDERKLNMNRSIISKSPYSRSAENITIIEDKKPENLNSSDKDLNKEQILNDFVNQKSKVIATQKITPEIKTTLDTQNHDSRYSRLPKELLPQDLGSLVKNVHGIFSSVSGSLKYAYNQTQKTPKPIVKNVLKPIPNGKLMDDIFEDDSEKIVARKLPEQYDKMERVDESPVRTSLQHPELKKEEGAVNLDGKEIEDCKKDVHKMQIEWLERVLAEQRKENAILRERVRQQVDELQQRDHTFKELEVKVDLMAKRAEQADREKDAAVMRYASVECTAIEAKRNAEKAALAEKAAHSEMELMSNKLKSSHAEKQRICQLYDDKCHELATSERELAKVREDLKEVEGRLKWTQSKLRMEMDAYKESSERADKLSQQVAELEAAKEAAVTNATDSVKAKQLEQELKESQAALILLRHERDDLDRRLSSTSQQLETCKKERDTAAKSLAEANTEVERLKEHNMRLEEEAAELAALRAQAALADTLSAQLQRATERALQAEESLSCERARAETCARREAAALQHAATLTADHVQQRASTTDTLNKAQALQVDNEALRERISALEQEVTRLQTALTEEADKRNKETRTLARKVAEITEEAAEANKKLEWEKGESVVLKKKHANAIRELNRELHRVLKRCEQLEAKIPPPEAATNRTGSISSISSGESASAQTEENHIQNGHTDTLPDIQVKEPDRQALIERIVSLQRAAARRAERCEFLEEHARQLTGELRGKAKLLRHLLCSLPAGAVASNQSDAHKKEIARLGGGAMAAVWGGEVTGMTLELSLEMNTKLQAVLEDALLKNITLKENMDTLGEEIARLKAQMNANDKES